MTIFLQPTRTCLVPHEHLKLDLASLKQNVSAGLHARKQWNWLYEAFFAALSLNVKCLSDVAHETLHILQQYNYVQLDLDLVNFYYIGLSLRIKNSPVVFVVNCHFSRHPERR